MTQKELIIHDRLSLLKCAKDFNVSFACRVFDVSRTRYYEIKKDFLKYGKAGLLPKPKIPNMPNKIKGEVEKKILSFVKECPTYGPVRLANELKRITKGKISYSYGGIYNVLLRNNLNLKEYRLIYSFSDENSKVILEKMLRKRIKKNMHVKTTYTGELLSQDSFKLGYIKGIGKIYTQAAIDCNCSFAFAKVYNRRTADTSVDLLKERVIAFYKHYDIHVKRILTDNGKEYTTHKITGLANHMYEKYLKENSVKHTYTEVRSPETNGYVERFHRTLLDEFFLISIRKKIYTNLNQLQADLDEFMIHYNFNRTHQGYKVNGKTPVSKFLIGIKGPPKLESKT